MYNPIFRRCVKKNKEFSLFFFVLLPIISRITASRHQQILIINKHLIILSLSKPVTTLKATKTDYSLHQNLNPLKVQAAIFNPNSAKRKSNQWNPISHLKERSGIIGSGLKEIKRHAPHECITEIKYSVEFPKGISIADTVAKHKTERGTRLKYSLATRIPTSFIRPPRTVRHQSSIWQENRYTSWPYKHSGGGRRGVLRGVKV